jgi:hypothetical protein
MGAGVHVLSQNRLVGIGGDPFASGGEKKNIFNRGF